MKLLAIVVALCVSQTLASLPEKILHSPNVELWKQWKLKYAKAYDTVVEEINRFDIWSQMLEKVKEHNIAYDLGLKSYTTAMNEYADMTGMEFAAVKFGNLRSVQSHDVPTQVEEPVNVTAGSVDWRSKGYVTPIKNQGQCGSCWSFSSTGGLEGQHFAATGNLVSLSEQQLVDCDTYCYGCNGGWVQKGFEWWINHGGATSESAYPYTGRDGRCQSGKPVAATIRSYHDVTKYSESALQSAVSSVGPVSIAIDASHWSFQTYSSGVYYEPSCSSYNLDHAVLVVGYGSTGTGSDYWIVKNSWGTGWGQDGYIWMARNANNNCGIASDATYPVV
jgi:cathepsin L